MYEVPQLFSESISRNYPRPNMNWIQRMLHYNTFQLFLRFQICHRLRNITFSNPISIAVNDAKSYKIYGNGVSKNEDGKYILAPGIGLIAKVFVEITNFDDSITVEEHLFRVLPFGPQYFTINEIKNKGILFFLIEDLKNAKIEAKIEDFLFPINIEIESFDIRFPRHKTLTIKGNLFTDEIYQLLKKTKKKI